MYTKWRYFTKLLFILIITLLTAGILSAQDSNVADSAEDTTLSPEPVIPESETGIAPATPEPKKVKSKYQTVTGLENWNHTFDISNRKKGIYNIYIKGSDKAGNLAYEGPFNIHIDPRSDIPGITITNPQPEMRIGGSHLNIVGTCVDDDAVDYVEVAINDGKFERAQGKEFWSFYYSTENIMDGRHTISARGVDIRGNTSEVARVNFNLDTTKPVNNVDSHRSGAIINGRVTLEGNVKDLNGVKELYYSDDGGNTYKNLKISYKKGLNQYNFKLKINTTQLADGPHVYWLKSIDRTLSVGNAAFLFFVDNKKPDIEILYPPPDMNINGMVQVAGKCSDELGITSLVWKMGKVSGEIPLTPGNPYWINEFDFTQSAKSETVNFYATDLTGNVKEFKVRFPIDNNADLPVVNIVHPREGMLLTGDFVVSGFVSDDDKPAKLLYQVDKGEVITLENKEGFSFIIPDEQVPPGSHTLKVWGIDVYDTPGNPVSVPFIKAGSGMEVSFINLLKNGEELPFYPGIETGRDANLVLSGKAYITDKIKTSEYKFGKGEAHNLSLKPGQDSVSRVFSIPIPPDIPFGVVEIAVKLTDMHERVFEFSSFIYITNYSKINDEPGIVIRDARLKKDGSIRISKEDPLRALFVGDNIKTVQLIPPSDILKVSHSGKYITVVPEKEGVSQNTTIRVTTIYDELFSYDNLIFTGDNNAPGININSPKTGAWISDRIMIKGTAWDKGGIQSAEYSLDVGESYKRLTLNGSGSEVNLNDSIPISGETDGTVTLFIRITDKAGNRTTRVLALNKDTRAPAVTLLSPRKTDTLYPGKYLLSTLIEDDGKLDRVEFSEDGERYTAFNGEAIYTKVLNWKQVGNTRRTVYIRATDLSGNVNNFSAGFTINGDPPPLPDDFKSSSSKKGSGDLFLIEGRDAAGTFKYESNFESAGSPPPMGTDSSKNILLTGKLKISGTISGVSEPVSELQVSYDGDSFKKTGVSFKKADNFYTFIHTLDTSASRDGPAAVWYKIIYASGQTAFSLFNYTADNSPCLIEILYPPVESLFNDSLTLCGVITDNYGIGSLSYTVDKETVPLSLADNNIYWNIPVDLSGFKGSVYSLALEGVDVAGNSVNQIIKIKIDRKTDLADVEILSPPDGAILSGSEVHVSGHVEDDDEARNIIYILDKEEPVSVSCNESFYFTLTGLSPGNHRLKIVPVDKHQLEGNSREISFTVTGDYPEIRLDFVTESGNEKQFVPGVMVNATGSKALFTARGSSNISKMEFAFNASDFKSLTPKLDKEGGTANFTINIPGDIPFGRNEIRINAVDTFDRQSEYASFFYKVDAGDIGIVDDEEIFFFDARMKNSGEITLDEHESITGLFNGREITAIALEPPVDFIKITNSGARLVLTATGNGISGNTKIKIETVHNRTFYSDNIRFIVDSRAPVITLASPATNDWLRNSLVLSGTVSDNVGMKSISFALNDAENFEQVTITATDNPLEYSFEKSIYLSNLPEGPFTLILKAEDEVKNVSTSVYSCFKDSKKVEISMITPGAKDVVNGLTTIVGRTLDDGLVKKVEISDDNETYTPVAGKEIFYFDIDFSNYNELPESFFIRTEDFSGNETVFEPPYIIDNIADKPTVEIQVPEEMAVMKNSFAISGMVFDDDGIESIHYKIDNNEFSKLEGSNNFSIPIHLDDITDNEHTIELYAVDIRGIEGDKVQRSFIISKEEPIAMVESPSIERTMKDMVTITGTAFDENGIEEVYVSFDSGNTYNKATGADSWHYEFDSRLIIDGTHSLLVKPVDKTGTDGLYATIINIDNTPPEISLDEPYDGRTFADKLVVDGRAFDNISLDELSLSIYPLLDKNSAETEKALLEFMLPTSGSFSESLDIHSLSPGWYNLHLDAADKANNINYISRNIVVEDTTTVDTIDFMYPADGAEMAGFFKVEGKVTGGATISNVILHVDERVQGAIPVNGNGFFSIKLSPDDIKDGEHVFRLSAKTDAGSEVVSLQKKITYSRSGAWVVIENFHCGDFITERPWLRGEAGYYLDPVEDTSSPGYKEYKELLKTNKIAEIEVSFDNGKTFRRASGTTKWKFRIETESIPDGKLPVIIKALYGNDKAVAQSVFQVDDTLPEVRVLFPEEGGRFNETIDVTGTASDENGLTDVSIILRKGDKAGYSVPSFIQGLYLDVHALGATTFEAGLGLTFFDQNVKLQAQFGIAPPGRFTGLVIGFKLLANILNLPFSYFFGPDWETFSMSLALGANFSYFSMSEDSIAFTNDGVILGAITGQFEFAKFHLKKQTFLNTYSAYAEYSLWFISSDIEAGFENRLSFGLRLGLL